MKKVLALVLVVVMVMSLAGCGGNLPAEGTYEVISMKTDGVEGLTEEYKKIISAMGVDNFGTLTIKGDGKAEMTIYGEKTESLTYDEKSFTGSDGVACSYTYSGNTITLNIPSEGHTVEMSFKK